MRGDDATGDDEARMGKDDRILQAERLERGAAELDRAAEHLRVAARHFREGEVPRACAHAMAAEGHVDVTEDLLRGLRKAHAEKARA